MSRLVLTLKADPAERLDMRAIVPSTLAGKSLREIEGLVIGTTNAPLTVADVFKVSGQPGEALAIAGGSPRLDCVGCALDGGNVTVEGDVGAYAGAGMTGGKLTVHGNAGLQLGGSMKGGFIHVTGQAGDEAGGMVSGGRYGMQGGAMVVEAGIGARAGHRMRRGTIVTRGRFGEGAGTRMMGGTLWTETGFDADPGMQMRRGTLIGPSVARLLPTFGDGGWHDLVILRILSRDATARLGSLAPKPLPAKVRKYSGDLGMFGKGELLLTA
ncbi:MAG: formylmethanofuran dehydrogenase subunit C [Hyphomicrobiaceae bacterium]